MSSKVRIWLALSGVVVGAAVAVYFRLQSAPPAPAPQPPVPAVQATTPPERQAADRYVDDRYGFSLTAAPGWYNETSGILRKAFVGARGALVKRGSSGQAYLRIEAMSPPATRPDPQAFLKTTREALASGGALKVEESAVLELAGCPAVSITTAMENRRAASVVRHVWVFGSAAQVYLTCHDQTGDYATNAAAFGTMLQSLHWQSPK